MDEYRPPALAYRPQGAEGQAADLRESLTMPLKVHEQRKARGEETAYRNASLEREKARDENANERERIAERDRVMAGTRADLRERERNATYDKGQQRLQEEAIFNRKKMLQQEHEALIRELYEAINSPGQDAVTRQNRIKAAQDALARAGYGVAVNEDTPNGPTLPPPVVEPPVAAAPAAPVVPAPPPKPSAPQHVTPKQANSLSSQLDAADKAYSKGLGVAPWLPGRSPVGASRALPPSVVKSDAMLSPDDPYNEIIK